MMFNKAVVLAGLVALPVIANAQLPVPYAGGGVGYAQTDVLDELSSAAVDDSDLGYKLYAGHRFNQTWSVEAGFADLGDASVTTHTGSATLNAYSLSLSGLAFVPVTQNIELFGKLGVHRWDADAYNSFGQRADDQGTDPVYGAGLQYAMGQLTLRAEYERYELDNDAVDMTTLGASWSF